MNQEELKNLINNLSKEELSDLLLKTLSKESNKTTNLTKKEVKLNKPDANRTSYNLIRKLKRDEYIPIYKSIFDDSFIKDITNNNVEINMSDRILLSYFLYEAKHQSDKKKAYKYSISLAKLRERLGLNTQQITSFVNNKINYNNPYIRIYRQYLAERKKRKSDYIIVEYTNLFNSKYSRDSNFFKCWIQLPYLILHNDNFTPSEKLVLAYIYNFQRVNKFENTSPKVMAKLLHLNYAFTCKILDKLENNGNIHVERKDKIDKRCKTTYKVISRKVIDIGIE